MFGWLRKDPKHLVECRSRMSEAFVDYPVYEPLHRQGPNCSKNLSREEVQKFLARSEENFSYFEEQRNKRLDGLRPFLKKFGVDMSLDDAGLAAVAAWLPGNCGALVANLGKEETVQAFYRHLVP